MWPRQRAQGRRVEGREGHMCRLGPDDEGEGKMSMRGFYIVSSYYGYFMDYIISA